MSANIKWITTIIWSGLLTGALDISAACIHYYFQTSNNPIRVFQYIASSIFGNKAYSGDWKMIVAGGLLHFMIAYAFTILFFSIYSRINQILKSRIFIGILYGIFIWLVMNKLILPLTRAELPKQFNSGKIITGILILIACIGIPLSYIADNYYRKITKHQKL